MCQTVSDRVSGCIRDMKPCQSVSARVSPYHPWQCLVLAEFGSVGVTCILNVARWLVFPFVLEENFGSQGLGVELCSPWGLLLLNLPRAKESLCPKVTWLLWKENLRLWKAKASWLEKWAGNVKVRRARVKVLLKVLCPKPVGCQQGSPLAGWLNWSNLQPLQKLLILVFAKVYIAFVFKFLVLQISGGVTISISVCRDYFLGTFALLSPRLAPPRRLTPRQPIRSTWGPLQLCSVDMGRSQKKILNTHLPKS